MQEEIKEFLESLLKAIVSKPDEVKVTKKVDEMGVLFSVELGEGDGGAVIGKKGRTIQAIRTIMSVVGAKNRAKINIKLLVPDKPINVNGRGKRIGLDGIDL